MWNGGLWMYVGPDLEGLLADPPDGLDRGDTGGFERVLDAGNTPKAAQDIPMRFER